MKANSKRASCSTLSSSELLLSLPTLSIIHRFLLLLLLFRQEMRFVEKRNLGCASAPFSRACWKTINTNIGCRHTCVDISPYWLMERVESVLERSSPAQASLLRCSAEGWGSSDKTFFLFLWVFFSFYIALINEFMNSNFNQFSIRFMTRDAETEILLRSSDTL